MRRVFFIFVLAGSRFVNNIVGAVVTFLSVFRGCRLL